jgi:hypothetical protein
LLCQRGKARHRVGRGGAGAVTRPLPALREKRVMTEEHGAGGVDTYEPVGAGGETAQCVEADDGRALRQTVHRVSVAHRT